MKSIARMVLRKRLKSKFSQRQLAAIHAAAATGDVKIVQLLLLWGAGVNETDASHLTPLHWAAKRGDLVMVTYLLRQGANPEAMTLGGSTPLSTAQQYREGNWQEVVRRLQQCSRTAAKQ